jgi:hypothetical protein
MIIAALSSYRLSSEFMRQFFFIPNRINDFIDVCNILPPA